jgi:hypothetical protein
LSALPCLALIASCHVGPGSLQSVPDEQRVATVVDTFYEAFNKRSDRLLSAVCSAEAMVAIIDPSRQISCRKPLRGWLNWPTARFLSMVRQAEGDRKTIIESDLAVVWSRYRLVIRDGDSLMSDQSGIDIFTLVKMDDSWKLVNVTISQEAEEARCARP